MPARTSSRGLEIDDDEAFARRAAVVQRIGWVALAVVVVAALVGLFGNGRLARTTASNADGGLAVGYARFARYHGPTTLVVRAAPAGAEQREVWFAEHYLEDFEVIGIFPEPESVRTELGRVTYSFNVDPAAELEVRLRLKPQRIGRLRAEAGAGEGGAVRFTQWVYP